MSIRNLARACVSCALSVSMAFSLTPLMAYAGVSDAALSSLESGAALNGADAGEPTGGNRANGDSAATQPSVQGPADALAGESGEAPDASAMPSEAGASEGSAGDSLDSVSSESSESSDGETVNSTADDGIALLSSDAAATVTEGWTKWGTLEYKVDDEGCFTLRPLGGAESATFDASGYAFSLYRMCPNAKSFKIEGNISCTARNQVDMYFSNCASLESVDLTGLDLSAGKVNRICFGWDSALTSIDMSKVKFGAVVDGSEMFSGCSALPSVDLSCLATSTLRGASYMFAGCSSLGSIDLSALNFEKGVDASYMFSGCTALTQLDLPTAGMSVKNATCMFGSKSSYLAKTCTSLASLDLSSLDLSSTSSAESMFAGCTSLASLDLSGVKFGSSVNASSMFAGCAALKTVEFPSSGMSVSNAYNMFGYTCSGSATAMQQLCCESLQSVDLSGVDFGSCTDTSRMFSGCESLSALGLSGADFSKVERANEMFKDCRALISLDLSEAKFESCTNASYMFSGCVRLKEVDLSGFRPSSSVSCSSMFSRCSALASVAWPSNAKIMAASFYAMFQECESLTSIDLSNFDTSVVKDMSCMFWGCEALSNLDLSNFSTENVKDMSYMFYCCISLKSVNVSSFNTTKVTNMTSMFWGCDALESLDLSSFDTSNADDMQSMFGWKGLKSVTLGEGFTFNGIKDTRQCNLPTYGSYEGYTGKWVSSADGAAYSSDEIPNNIAATYTAQKTEEVSTQAVYRMYNPITSEHLFTTDYSEYQKLIDYDWVQEGMAWSSPTSGKAVYRLYNPGLGALRKMSHHYTSDYSEVQNLVNNWGWVLDFDGEPIFYSAEGESSTVAGADSVYRLYNDGLSAHLFTMDASEVSNLVTNWGWKSEGVAFAAMPIE